MPKIHKRVGKNLNYITMPGVYRVIAPKKMGKLPKGFVLQVPTNSNGKPTVSDIKEALIRVGFNDQETLGWSSPGNWDIEAM